MTKTETELSIALQGAVARLEFVLNDHRAKLDQETIENIEAEIRIGTAALAKVGADGSHPGMREG